VLDFVGWLRDYNDSAGPGAAKVGFYGLDRYSSNASTAAVLDYLDTVDPAAAERARGRYAALDLCGRDAPACGVGAAIRLNRALEKEVIARLVDLRRDVMGDLPTAEDDYFCGEEHRQLMQDAERYYRMMYRGGSCSWNLRERHMAQTLNAVATFLHRDGRAPKLVVWAHTSHLGDARATEMGLRGECNIGQLMRERHGRDVVLVGLTAYEGTVTAASHWDGPAERMPLRVAPPPSYEALFHEASFEPFLLCLRGRRLASLGELRLERAIGAIYRPETENKNHYFYASLPAQFDALVHCDRTRASLPLDYAADPRGVERSANFALAPENHQPAASGRAPRPRPAVDYVA
jgi:erythromycin esterase-like protein